MAANARRKKRDGGVRPTPFSAFQSYLESYGSTRLTNCLRAALSEYRFPYESVDDYLSDSSELRFRNLRRIPNVGKKTATEFDELVEAFADSRKWMVEDADSAPIPATKMPSSETTSSPAADPFSAPGDRYAVLTKREMCVIERRFAIGLNARQTLEEIGQTLRVTRERVRQIERKALKKLCSSGISQHWKLFVDENRDQVIEALFGGQLVLRKPFAIHGEFALAVAIVYETPERMLQQTCQQFEEVYWVRPNLDVLRIQTTKNRLAAMLENEKTLPLAIREAAETTGEDGLVVESALIALHGFQLFAGWIVRAKATSRKRRVVNILNLFHEGRLCTPASLWDIKLAYWSYHSEDKCTGRDLLLCMQDHSAHFANLHGLGWLCLVAGVIGSGTENSSLQLSVDVPAEFYARPIRTGGGLANCVFEMFERYGPMRLSDAAERFRREYPQYALASMYPMLVYYAVFVRFAPGVVGIQAHRLNESALRAARTLILAPRDLDLYLFTRKAGPPLVRYPLWDSDMELLWAKWLSNNGDSVRLGALLGISRINEWKLSESERIDWEKRKEGLQTQIPKLPMPAIAERRIDVGILSTALVAASLFGCVNWMYLNQALGWRIETYRAALVLAVLIHSGMIEPTGAWSETHILTDRGRRTYQSLFGSPAARSVDAYARMTAFFEKPYLVGPKLGWAGSFEFDHLRQRIRDFAGELDKGAIDYEGDESRPEAHYEGIMGDELRRLIEGE